MLLFNGLPIVNGSAWSAIASKTAYLNIAHSTRLEWMD
jgi:hypothetical protein